MVCFYNSSPDGWEGAGKCSSRAAHPLPRPPRFFKILGSRKTRAITRERRVPTARKILKRKNGSNDFSPNRHRENYLESGEVHLRIFPDILAFF
jgi:hypothetical protein